jgi:dimethylglycine dehydrogenase
VAETMGNPAREHMVILSLDAAQTDASNADATGGEPIFKDGKGIGRVTSGAYSYSVGQSLALGFVSGAVAGDEVEVMVLGVAHKAVILAEPLFDASGEILRG